MLTKYGSKISVIIFLTGVNLDNVISIDENDFIVLEPDDLLENIIGGNIYNARTILDHVTPQTDAVYQAGRGTNNLKDGRKYLSKPNINGTAKLKKEGKMQKQDAESIQNTETQTEHPVNLTIDKLRTRRVNVFVQKVLNDNRSAIPDFETGEDDPVKNVKKLDNILRVKSYPYDKDIDVKKKRKLLQLMQQFVYMVRYMMPVTQLLRNKHKKDARYRLGYCFCQYQIIYLMLRRLGSTMWSNIDVYNDMYPFVKIYEKVVRLNIDMRDLKRLMVKLEYQKNIAADPNFYDVSLGSD